MTTLAAVARAVRDTNAQISRMEREISANPHEKGLLINLSALQKRLKNLEAQFAELSNRDFLDVCDYRLIPSFGESYPISAVGSVLVAFQSMVSVILESIKHGPKLRARISPDVASMSSLDFAYTFQGSLGFTLTVPNERLLAVSSELDMAIESAFQLALAQETSDIAALARKIGVASVRTAYIWAQAHAKHQMSAEIDWKRGKIVRNHTFLETTQLEKVTRLIEQTSEVTEEPMTLRGTLVAINTSARTFQFVPIDGDEIRGSISENVSFFPPFSVPAAAVVNLVKRTQVLYSIEKDEISWVMTGRETP